MCAPGSRRPRRPRAANRAPFGCSPSARRCPPTTCAPLSRQGSAAFGENYAQELRDKRAALADDDPAPAWHFVGPLQSNKVKYVVGQVALIHSVDSPALLAAIDGRGAPQACLVQVNVAGEAQKRGVAPEALPALLDAFAAAQNVRCDGLMLIPPSTRIPAPTSPRSARCAIEKPATPVRTSISASCRWE